MATRKKSALKEIQVPADHQPGRAVIATRVQPLIERYAELLPYPDHQWTLQELCEHVYFQGAMDVYVMYSEGRAKL